MTKSDSKTKKESNNDSEAKKSEVNPNSKASAQKADALSEIKLGSRKGISRRDFLTGTVTGIVVAGAAAAAAGYLSGPGKSTTGTQTVTQTSTTTAPGTTQMTTETTTKTTTVAPPPPPTITLNVNGKDHDIPYDPAETLQHALQYQLGLTGAKTMCDRGECGSCSVIIDNKAVLSCSTLAVEVAGKKIVTVEGLAADPKWAPLFQSYQTVDAFQCGYCTPGFIVTAADLLSHNPNPTVDQIKEALSGNICRCGSYPRHPTAILQAAPQIKGGS